MSSAEVNFWTNVISLISEDTCFVAVMGNAICGNHVSFWKIEHACHHWNDHISFTYPECGGRIVYFGLDEGEIDQPGLTPEIRDAIVEVAVLHGIGDATDAVRQ